MRMIENGKNYLLNEFLLIGTTSKTEYYLITKLIKNHKMINLNPMI